MIDGKISIRKVVIRMEPLSFGARITALRKNCRMTQVELAQLLGVTNQAVSKWENEQCCPDIMLLPKLADCFGVSIDALFGRENCIPASSISDLPWPEDENLRAVCYIGHRLTDCQEIRRASVELCFTGSVDSIFSEFSVTCKDSSIYGTINAGTGVSCGDVGGDVNAGDWVHICGDVSGNVCAGDSVDCGNIGGNAFAGNCIRCQSIRGGPEVG